MADNYLEKRMADYQAGKLTAVTRHATSSTPRIFIISDCEEATTDAVRRYRSEGMRTAFTFPDSKRGAALAQATGAQCHHMPAITDEAIAHSLAYIERHWGGVDKIEDLRNHK